MLCFAHEGLEVDSCPECFGLWFDREELKEFLQRPGLAERLEAAPGHAESASGPRLCPSGHGSLQESALGDVQVDVCPKCRGIWLDQGELERAVEQYRQGRRGNLVVLNQIAEGLRALRRQP